MDLGSILRLAGFTMVVDLSDRAAAVDKYDREDLL